MAILNEALAKKQGITQKQRDNLANLYDYMYELINQANKEKKLNKKKGKVYAEKMRNLEFSLQENWNFPQDALCHTWWNKFNDCICPEYDNRERFGHEKIITCGCNFHGYICDENS